MRKFEFLRQPLLGELAMSQKRARRKKEKKMPFILRSDQKLREMIPEKDPLFLLVKSNEHILKVGKMVGELDMTQVIDEVLGPSQS